MQTQRWPPEPTPHLFLLLFLLLLLLLLLAPPLLSQPLGLDLPLLLLQLLQLLLLLLPACRREGQRWRRGLQCQRKYKTRGWAGQQAISSTLNRSLASCLRR
jgi:hypothetical protein